MKPFRGSVTRRRSQRGVVGTLSLVTSITVAAQLLGLSVGLQYPEEGLASLESGLQAHSDLGVLTDLKVTSGAPREVRSPGPSRLLNILRNIERSALRSREPLTKMWATPLVREDFGGPGFYAHKIAPGQTLSAIWQSYGGSPEEASAAARALATVGGRKSLRAGDRVEVSFGEDGMPNGLRKRVAPGKIFLLAKDDAGKLNPTLQIEPLEVTERVISGVVESSFLEAAYRQGLSRQVADLVVDLFADRVDFRRDLHPGDRFSVVYTEAVDSNGEVVKVEHVAGASLETGGKAFYAVRYEGKSGQAFFYDAHGEALGDYFLRYPVTFSRISSVFNSGRLHPVLKVKRPHNGVDFAAPTGTPVRVVADGIVTFAGWAGGGGKTIKIKHNDRYSTAYMHLSRMETGVRIGSRVRRGQIIGAVGMTGLATGPHLHFAFYDNGRYTDPLKVTLPRMTQDAEKIPPTVLASMIGRLNQERTSIHLASSERGKRVG